MLQAVGPSSLGIEGLLTTAKYGVEVKLWENSLTVPRWPYVH